MIVLLSCSIGSLASNTSTPSTGEVCEVSDSIKVSYDDLRIVNSKLIECEYNKEINIKLKSIISNDSTIIANYENLNKKLNNDNKKYIKQRNIGIGAAVIGFMFAIIFGIK